MQGRSPTMSRGWPGAALAIVMCPAAHAAPVEPAAAPKLQPNDTWTYQDTVEKRVGGWHQTHVETTLVRAGPKIIVVTSKQVGSTMPPLERMAGADWSRSRSVNGLQTIVNPPLSFPLADGKSWTVDYMEADPNRLHSSEHIKVTYTVAGAEDVTVPAGTFRAIKIEADGEWTAAMAAAQSNLSGTRTDATGATMVTQTNRVKPATFSGRLYKAFWYVPSVKKWAKSVEEYFDANGARNERVLEELESYKVGAGS